MKADGDMVGESVLYMAVTADVFELPLFVSDSVKELALTTGFSMANIHSRLSKERKGIRRVQGGRSGIKFVRIEMDDLED